MTNLQLKGPRAGDPTLVSFHKEYSMSQGETSTLLMVTIRLGNKLRVSTEHHTPSDELPIPLALPELNESLWGDHTDPTHDDTVADPEEGPQVYIKKLSEPPIPIVATEKEAEDSGSELEILEVRVLEESDTDTESELSSLDEELNNVLSSTTAPTQEPEHVKIHIPTLYKPIAARTSPAPPGYRNLPPNLVNTIQRELNLFFDNGDDDLEVVGKLVFSLKDPYLATKIRLPVKASTCRHFECFDLDNFCVFHKLPFGVKNTLRRSLTEKCNDARKLEQLFLKQQQRIANGTLLFKSPGLVYPQFSEHGQMFFSEVFNRTPPLYKCPLCDEKFGLKQLYISDVINFFVKTSPIQTTRIELVESDRYKIIDDEAEMEVDTSEVVVLDEEDDDYDETNAPPPAANKSFNDDFNDGLDDVLVKISQGDGTWGNPMTLD